MEFLTNVLEGIPQFDSIRICLQEGQVPVSVKGLVESARPYFLHTLQKNLGKQMVVITCNDLHARRIHRSLEFFSGKEILYLPSREPILHQVERKSRSRELDRVHGLFRMASGDYRICVTAVEALCMRVSSPQVMREAILSVRKGSGPGPGILSLQLAGLGYQPVHMVENPGEFSLRGDILDVFSPGMEYPARVEFFGDDVDRIRYFNTDTQRSICETACADFLPLSEQILKQGEISWLLALLRQEGFDASELETGTFTLPDDRFFPLLEDSSCGFSYLDQDAVVVLDQDLRCEKQMEMLLREEFIMHERWREKHRIPAFRKGMYCGIWEALGSSRPHLVFPDVSGMSGKVIPRKEISISTRENTHYGGNISLLVEDLKRWKEKKRKIVVFTPGEKSARILSDHFLAEGLPSYISAEDSPKLTPGVIAVVPGGLTYGVEFPEDGICFIGSGKVFHKERAEQGEKKKGRGVQLFASLSPGDYVVHDIHGIGLYAGMVPIEADGSKKDYLKILYRNNDCLYIPTGKMNLVQKYIGAEGKTPRLSRLGGGEWEETKKKVRESIRTMAFELTELYAQRKQARGHAYGPDTVWQVAFEEEFSFEETSDQLRCTEEIKQDMESPIPMDRLLCGDVGFGKTEVALRAVFKAVMDGKQVAFLVPTTVLAHQHYRLFCERMKSFPVTVELLSRFRTQTQQKGILKSIRDGTADVVVGTHRILQKDVEFRDLGLLVIDEEQRFGVEHKEQIKCLKKEIDVLTLTATPIPRTLHMTLSGIRDISMIEDPPGKRFPIQTMVMEYDGEVIRNAIERELARGGQVFYLYNRVRGIETKYRQLMELLGDGRVTIRIAHGQMEEKKLERTMIGFLEGEFDVLLCTTIIEAGLDMPNVNTLVIEDADRLGLAQLYQIRGRVGRSDRVAYAYITHARGKVVTEDASKRLETIREFNEFGSGFKVAMRDLEIRGAGNLLGAAQHGHMEKVGYDLYIRLIHQEMADISGDATLAETGWEASVELSLDAFIPERYIGHHLHRMDVYRKIAVVSGERDKTELLEELTDRYGEVPGEVEQLLDVSIIKHAATRAGIERITHAKNGLVFTYRKQNFPGFQFLEEAANRLNGTLILRDETSAGVFLKSDSCGKEILEKAKKILETVLAFQ